MGAAMNRPTRRQVLLSAGAAGAITGGAAGKAPAAVRQADIEGEIRRRAEEEAGRRYLVVDYYRIRRRLAYRLPVTSLSVPRVSVPTISGYPWATWMLWALEERVHSLGWAAEWFKSEPHARAAARDIEALASWPKYCQFRQPDLSSGHAGRLLWAAATKWRWVSQELREKIRAACARHVDEVLPFSDAHYGPVRSSQDLLAQPSPHRKLANIPLIGTTAAALTAHVAGHPASPVLNERVRAIMGAVLELRSKGVNEAVAYDGYILDFIADWLGILPAGERNEILEHPNLKHYLEECYLLAAPGAIEQVAELSDVEPKEMPYHYSAQAKLARFQADPVRAWYLRGWPRDWIRADALGALHPLVEKLRGTPPQPGALNAHYAAVLRTGWAPEDLAVAVSCTNSPMGHLQADNGTLVMGTRGEWIISDPGYQQYMNDTEREFTLGPAAHNYPVINGLKQDKKDPKLLSLERVAPDLFRVRIELAGCYPREAGLTSAVRTVWLHGRRCVVVADRMQAAGVRSLHYHWHGHPEAAWWAQDGWALVHLHHTELWFTSPQAQLSHEKIQRLPASRGQLTLVTEADPAAPAVWWVFALADAPPAIEPLAGGQAIQVLGRRFEA
jgi:hypothetical protein